MTFQVFKIKEDTLNLYIWLLLLINKDVFQMSMEVWHTIVTPRHFPFSVFHLKTSVSHHNTSYTPRRKGLHQYRLSVLLSLTVWVYYKTEATLTCRGIITTCLCTSNTLCEIIISFNFLYLIALQKLCKVLDASSATDVMQHNELEKVVTDEDMAARLAEILLFVWTLGQTHGSSSSFYVITWCFML